ncbi:hypothetical protein [Rhizobium rhizosphaerae]|nr:hypothetical protein [Xaviernesmea rhizosphaerae]
MARWFDLHLYYANWGTRRLMLRVPNRFIDVSALGPFLDEIDWVTVRKAGENVIFDIVSDDDPEDEDTLDEYAEEEEAGMLASFVSLRTDLIDGDLRLFYLLWLKAVEDGAYEDDAVEPRLGVGPLTPLLTALATLLRLDEDLLQAAAEGGAAQTATSQDWDKAVAALSDEDRTAFLVRFLEGDPHARTDLKRRLSSTSALGKTPQRQALRTVGMLRTRAESHRLDRQQACAKAEAVKRKRAMEEIEKQRRERIRAVAARGEAVWRDVEEEIARRNASGYAKAIALLQDLKALAAEKAEAADFRLRLMAIRKRHAQKARFIERLTAAEMASDD